MESDSAVYLCNKCLYRYVFAVQPSKIAEHKDSTCRDCDSGAPLLVTTTALAPMAWLHFWPV